MHLPCRYITWVKFNTNLLHNAFYLFINSCSDYWYSAHRIYRIFRPSGRSQLGRGDYSFSSGMRPCSGGIHRDHSRFHRNRRHKRQERGKKRGSGSKSAGNKKRIAWNVTKLRNSSVHRNAEPGPQILLCKNLSAPKTAMRTAVFGALTQRALSFYSLIPVISALVTKRCGRNCSLLPRNKDFCF